METQIYVGNLSFETTDSDIRELFSQAGTVASATLSKDRDSGQSKGFAFVEMSNQAESEKAIQMFNGKALGNRELKVNLARPREERGSGGFSRGGGYGAGRPGGGYGSGRPGGGYGQSRPGKGRQGPGGQRKY